MARKRPSIIDQVDPARAPPRARTTEGPSPKSAAERDVQHTSIYLPRPDYRRIREIAVAQDCRPHDVIMEGIGMVLEKYGYPAAAEAKRSTKAR